MARPFKKRTPKSFGADMGVLSRLRTAVLMDRSLPEKEAKLTVLKIDELVKLLLKLSDSIEDEEVA